MSRIVTIKDCSTTALERRILTPNVEKMFLSGFLLSTDLSKVVGNKLTNYPICFSTESIKDKFNCLKETTKKCDNHELLDILIKFIDSCDRTKLNHYLFHISKHSLNNNTVSERIKDKLSENIYFDSNKTIQDLYLTEFHIYLLSKFNVQIDNELLLTLAVHHFIHIGTLFYSILHNIKEFSIKNLERLITTILVIYFVNQHFMK